MKKAILTAMTVLVAWAAATAHAAEPSLTVLLAGGSEANTISIKLSPDGRTYVIDTLGQPLEVGGSVCWHPEDQPSELLCEAAPIGGFEVNAGGGDDSVIVAAAVPIAVTLRGGPGNDRLVGGANSDKLVGGPGDDVLVGRAGKDSLFGGAANDRLVGGPDYDVLRGEGGEDILLGGAGDNYVTQ
jgi:Ca2+-binding RTX toxin-like protein